MPSNPPTLVMRLQGGIGNQLFQWAYGRLVAERNAAPLVFELSAYPDRAYGRVPIAERLWPEVPRVTAPFPANTKFVRESPQPWAADGPIPWRLALPAGTERVVFSGYWQDARVVDDRLAAVLLARLRAAVAPEIRARDAAWRARSSPSVAVHLRRHDYKNHGLANETYYIDALRWLQARLGDLEVFVFSDEPNYARIFLEEAGLRVRMMATGDDLGDLLLISACSHQVIANSTFSWWGARLSARQDVIYPLPWSFAHTPSGGLLPAHWRGIPEAVERHVSERRYLSALEAAQRSIEPAR